MQLDDLIAQFAELGLLVDQVQEFGTLVRCKVDGDKGSAKAGWYVVHENRRSDGTTYYTGTVGNFRLGEQRNIQPKGLKLTAEEKAAFKKQMADAKKARDLQRRWDAKRAAKRADRAWLKLSTTGTSPYLQRKQVKGYGVRYYKDRLAVPMMDITGAIAGLQIIYPEKHPEKGRDKDYWPYGVDKDAKFHQIGEVFRSKNKPVVVCEGYATGASIHEATRYPVFVAFDAGNLLRVAQAIRGVYPRNPIIVASDDDFRTQRPNGDPWNPGVEKATATAQAVNGYVVRPVFPAGVERGTDFNDLHVAKGLSAVREQVRGVLAACDVVDWRSDLILTRDGELKPDITNISLILDHDPAWAGVLGYDDFSYRILKRRAPPYAQARVGEWSDSDTAQLRIWLGQNYRLTPRAADAHDAVLVAAKLNTFHPVREYLESLDWDGEQRVEQWLQHYMGVDDSEYVRAVGSKFLIAAVARVMRPPVKADCVLILEGNQGLGKSSALSVLGGEWFSDSPFAIGDKDGFTMLQGVWLCELAELDSFNKVESTRAKQFFGSESDRFRPAYGRCAETFPRQCVFAGTTNQDSYLRDATGNRRYWPVRATHIDSAALAQDRDQLWAEAMHLFRSGVPWWPEESQKHLFESEQEDRFDSDVWEDLVIEWLQDPRRTQHVRLVDVMEEALRLEPPQQKPPEQRRVANILTRLGWKKVRPRVNGQRRPMYEMPAAWRVGDKPEPEPF
ncbi:MAG: VapE family protein [Marinobacter sp.]|nr:VapE family protein [Marinobacter sp.]